jgi:hypothetical protein
MRALFIVLLASGSCLAGCGQTADTPAALASPVSPTAVTGLGTSTAAAAQSAAAKAVEAKAVEVPFHSEIAWTKVVNGGDPSPCQGLHGNPPDETVYLMRNTSEGQAVTTHLGAGNFEIHTCVYGTMVNGKPVPAGWFAGMRWTAANGDVLLAVSKFLHWTGTPGKSVAVDKVTFQKGGTGRFAFAEGDGMGYVNAPERTAIFEGTLRYGKKEK